jgi:hypothetical protein
MLHIVPLTGYNRAGKSTLAKRLIAPLTNVMIMSIANSLRDAAKREFSFVGVSGWYADKDKPLTLSIDEITEVAVKLQCFYMPEHITPRWLLQRLADHMKIVKGQDVFVEYCMRDIINLTSSEEHSLVLIDDLYFLHEWDYITSYRSDSVTIHPLVMVVHDSPVEALRMAWGATHPSQDQAALLTADPIILSRGVAYEYLRMRPPFTLQEFSMRGGEE